MVKLGIIGVGIISEFHLKGLATTPARITAISDVNEERGRSVALKYDARYFKNYHELLDFEDVEGVIVALPNDLHYQCCLDAINAGKHIFCEKPLTTKVEHSLDLVRRVRATDLIFQVGYMKRFNPGFRMVKEVIPQLGELEFFNFHIFLGSSPKNLTNGENESWHENPKRAGGGFVVHSGSHHFDLLRFYLGDVEKIRAKVRFEEKTARDYYLNAQLQMKSGVNVQFQMGRIDVPNLGPSLSIVRDGWDEGVEFIGTKGIIRVENPTWQGYKPAQVIKWVQGEVGPTRFWVDSDLQWVEEMKAFVTGIEKHQLLGPSVVDGYKVDNIIDKIYLSSAEGVEVAVKEELI